jgi:hypothetical protein
MSDLIALCEAINACASDALDALGRVDGIPDMRI